VGFNVAPQGFLAVDIRPIPEFEPLKELGFSPAAAALIASKPPGWYQLGIAAGIAEDVEETHAFGHDYEYSTMLGVLFIGPLFGYVGVDKELRKVKELIKLLNLYDLFAYEKDPKLGRLKRELAARGEVYNVITLTPRTRPVNPDLVQVISALLFQLHAMIEEIIPFYGTVISRYVKWMHPKVKGLKHTVKPRGPTAFGVGNRAWAVMGFPTNYSIKHKTRTSFTRGRIKSVAEGLVEKLDPWRAWKSVRWGDEWIEED